MSNTARSLVEVSTGHLNTLNSTTDFKWSLKDENTMEWHDWWIGSKPLAVAYNKLYSMVKDKFATVKKLLDKLHLAVAGDLKFWCKVPF